MRREKGLTLIELAVVLIVIGTLLGMGVGMIGALIKGVKYRESREKLRKLHDSVLGEIYQSKAVPQNPFTFSVSKDSFGNDLYYVYASVSDVCSTNSTTLQLCKDGNCTSNVLYVVLAKGGNYNLQSNIPTNGTYQNGGGYTVAGDGYNVVVYDYGTEVDNFTDSKDVNRVEGYDDMYEFVTLQEAKARVCPPPSSGGGDGGQACNLTTVRIRNTSGARKSVVISPSSTTCDRWNNNAWVSISTGETLNVYPFLLCPLLLEGSIGFDDACAIDTGGNGNGDICYNGAGSFSDC